MTDTFDKVLEAISYATRRHGGQLRRDGQTPYAAHPMRVLVIVRDRFGVRDVEILAAAVLHDVIEDTPADRESLSRRFGDPVADYVSMLSKDMRLPEEVREKRYLEQLAAAPVDVKLIKLADLYDNLTDTRGLGASARDRAVARARDVTELFGSSLPAEHQAALDLVRERIDALAAG